MYYEPKRCAYNSSCCENSSDMPGVLLCTCHCYCQTHCLVLRSNDKIYKVTPTWFGLLKPYKNLAPTSAWNSHVLRLLTHAVNGVDPKNGLSAIHGFFNFVSGDKDLELRSLLEVGVDADVRYLAPDMHVNVVINNDLRGGTALHFCVNRGFLKCAEALLDAGVKLDALTDEGKTAVELCPDGSPMKALLVNETLFNS